MHDSQIALLLRSVWPGVLYFGWEARKRVVANYKSGTFFDEIEVDQLDAALEELQNIQI
jgi:hypothetical protein